MSGSQRDVVIQMAREDFDGMEDQVSIPDNAMVTETNDGYWVQAWVFIEKETG